MGANTLIVLPTLASIAILAAVAYVVWRRDRPIAPGACPACNYDLDGKLNNGCPECGWRREQSPTDELRDREPAANAGPQVVPTPAGD